MILYGMQQYEIGLILVGTTSKGVCFVGLGGEKHDLFKSFCDTFFYDEKCENSKNLEPVFNQLDYYLNGYITSFDLPLDAQGTGFQKKVWNQLTNIPYGETHSYGRIASAVGKPSASRAVGRACSQNPVSLLIPCHRVVSKNGLLTGYRWGIERKLHLLNLEYKTTR